jgi:hypothetical protein
MTMRRWAATLVSNPAAALGDLVFAAFGAWTIWFLVEDSVHADYARIPVDVAVLAFYGWLVRRRLTHRRSSIRSERRALKAATERMRHKDLWLNRDEHTVFACSRSVLGVQLAVIDEDDMHAIEADGSGTFVATTYTMLRGGTDVLRQVNGSKVTMLPDGTPDVATERKGEWRKWRDAWKMAGDLMRGYLAPDPAELVQVARLLADAERIGSLDNLPGDDGAGG